MYEVAFILHRPSKLGQCMMAPVVCCEQAPVPVEHQHIIEHLEGSRLICKHATFENPVPHIYPVCCCLITGDEVGMDNCPGPCNFGFSPSCIRLLLSSIRY